MKNQISHQIGLPELKFSEEEYISIEDLAGNNYSPEKIAIFLQVDKKAFLKLWFEHESEVRKRYEIGRLSAEFQISNAQKKLAEAGNITAAQIFLKIKENTEIEAIRNQVLFGHDAY